MNKFPINLVFLVLLSACAPKEYFRTNITETPCELTQTTSCDTANLVASKEDDFKLGFVEIDDQGQFYDNGQVDALIKLLKSERQQQYVTVYVHAGTITPATMTSMCGVLRSVLRKPNNRIPTIT